MLVHSFREAYFFIPFNVIHQIIIDWLEAFIENFEMISGKDIDKLLYVFIISISVFNKLISVIIMVPSRCNRIFNGNTVLGLFLFETFI